MIRITVEEVISAYTKIKALPIRGAYKGPDFCLCPLAAVAYARDAWAPSVDDDEGAQDLARAIRESLGLDARYFHGFVGGFDLGDDCEMEPDDLFKAGWTDGSNAADAVFSRLWGRTPKKIWRRYEPPVPPPPKPSRDDDEDIPF